MSRVQAERLDFSPGFCRWSRQPFCVSILRTPCPLSATLRFFLGGPGQDHRDTAQTPGLASGLRGHRRSLPALRVPRSQREGWGFSERFFPNDSGRVLLFVCFTAGPTLCFWSKSHLFMVYYSSTVFSCGGANLLTFCYGFSFALMFIRDIGL